MGKLSTGFCKDTIHKTVIVETLKPCHLKRSFKKKKLTPETFFPPHALVHCVFLGVMTEISAVNISLAVD